MADPVGIALAASAGGCGAVSAYALLAPGRTPGVREWLRRGRRRRTADARPRVRPRPLPFRAGRGDEGAVDRVPGRRIGFIRRPSRPARRPAPAAAAAGDGDDPGLEP